MRQRLLICLALLLATACSNRFDHGGRGGDTGTGSDSDGDSDTDSDGDTDTDSDADSDTDTDTDSDTDTYTDEVDCSECTDPECLGSVSGQILYWDDSPYVGNVQICGSNCVLVATQDDGTFFYVMLGGCFGFDPEGELVPDLSLLLQEGYAKYALSLTPPYFDIDSNNHVDVGAIYYVPLSGSSADYTESGGAAVDLAGVSFTVPPGALGAEDLDIHVFEFPLADWTPPFVLDSMNIDALYYLSPHFQNIAEGQEIALTIDPAAAGWSDGDSGDLYRQGDFLMGDYLHCGDHDLHIGAFEPCGTASAAGGEITTSEIDRFTWFGLSKSAKLIL